MRAPKPHRLGMWMANHGKTGNGPCYGHSGHIPSSVTPLLGRSGCSSSSTIFLCHILTLLLSQTVQYARWDHAVGSEGFLRPQHHHRLATEIRTETFSGVHFFRGQLIISENLVAWCRYSSEETSDQCDQSFCGRHTTRSVDRFSDGAP